MIREADIKILQLQAKECHRLLKNNQKLSRGKEGFCQHLSFGLLASRTVRQYIFIVQPTHSVVLSYDSPMKLIDVVNMFGSHISNNDIDFED